MINNHFGINTCGTDIDFYDTFSWNEGENAKSGFFFKQVSEIEILGPLLLTSTNFIPMMDK